MTQKIYDTKTRAIIDFQPLTAGKVSLYVCGPTVQSAPHVGHLRSALVYDQIRRWFEASGLDVTLVRNVTDIDDKILVNAAAAGVEPWWALASRVEREFSGAYSALGVAEPTVSPRATGHITQMIAMIAELIERGHAYQATDGSANVYFDVLSWPSYGELTNQTLEQMEDGGESAGTGKRNPQDFALWKAYRDTEPATASWPSPWGAGRPGWHIECSAMATYYLGDVFDLHGGGLDLRFPHHENELAQAAAAGCDFARHWLHNGLVNTGGQKMSKSLGNSFFASDLLAAAAPIVVRYFLGSAHYRSQLDFNEKSLDEAAAAFGRIEGAIARAAKELGAEMPSACVDFADTRAVFGDLPVAFVQAMQDDFALPLALAEVHGAVRTLNTALDSGDKVAATQSAKQLVAMLGVLHLDPRHPAWATGGDSAESAALDKLVRGLIEQRATARAEKDFATADRIRDALTETGIALEDGVGGTEWSLL